MSDTDEERLSQAMAEARRLTAAVTAHEMSIVDAGPLLLACFAQIIEIAPSADLTSVRQWARDFSLQDWAAHDTPLQDWQEFKTGLDLLIPQVD